MKTRAVRWVAYAAVPLAAIALAYLATRSPKTPDGPAGHQHVVAGAGDIAQPLSVSAVDAQRIGVTYAAAITGPLGKEIRTVGQVTFDETRVRSVSLKVDGWVEQLYVNFDGQSVVAGMPLLAIYSPMLVAAQEELRIANRLGRDVARGSDETRANAASLVESTKRRLANWDVPAQEVARLEAGGEVQRALVLSAPVSGFVIEKNVLQGQRIMAGEPLFRIADLGVVWVEGEVFERDLASIRLEQRVIAEFEALPNEQFSGRIRYVYPTVNPETRTTRVRVQLANPGLRLKPGMYATLVWTGAGVASALSVPRSAVVSTGTRHLVFVKRRDGMLEPRLVETGITTDDRIEILRGLVRGDSIVTSATFLVDAESNLATLMGGMGNMPGMDMAAPRKPD